MLRFVVQTGNEGACFLFVCMCLPGLGLELDGGLDTIQRMFASSAFFFSHTIQGCTIIVYFFIVHKLTFLNSQHINKTLKVAIKVFSSAQYKTEWSLILSAVVYI